VIANETVRLALHQYKYHRALWMEPCLTQWLVSGAVPALTNQGWTCIVPVPLHSVRYREREFNQASRLAHRLGAALGIPVQENWIVRTAPTPTQTRLNRRERAVNVQGAFGAVKNASARNQSVIIVDDILTTGATTNAVAQVVRELGADRICVWTLARAVL
jgi:ComF family protein